MKTYVHKKSGAKVRLTTTLESPEWEEVADKPEKEDKEKKGG